MTPSVCVRNVRDQYIQRQVIFLDPGFWTTLSAVWRGIRPTVQSRAVFDKDWDIA